MSRRVGSGIARAALVTLLTVLGQATASANDLKVTYLGNAGFLIDSGEQRVLVDALYRGGVSPYTKIPAEALEKLERAEAPYDGIDLVLVTHRHADHFDAQSVARHLQSNPEARFISTPQVVDDLKGAVDNFDALASRVRGELPAEELKVLVELPGIEVHVLNLHHGRSRNPPVDNLGFVVDIGGKTFAHFGDTEVSYGELRVHRLDQLNVDLAFVDYWELLRAARMRVFHDNLAPERTVAMHVPGVEAPVSYFGQARTRDAMLAKILAAKPDVIFFEQLETKTIGSE